MAPRPRRLRIRQEDGFSIIESMVALAFLAVVFTIAAGVLASSLGALSRARVEAMASNLGQALIEEVRLVPYKDVGTTTGSPQGVFPESTERTIDNRTFDIQYQITFEGSATGLDIIAPGGGSPSGDGTGSSFDSGIDYKRVRVTITDRNNRLLSPTVFDTLVSPPDIAANEGLANVRVNVVKVDVLADDTTPLPQVCISSAANSYTMTPNALGEVVFIGVNPNGANPALPDYWYTARIGAACGTSDPLSGWIIAPGDIGTVDRTNVAPTATGTINLTLTKPQSVDVTVVNADGSQLPATLDFLIGTETHRVEAPTGVVTVDEIAPGVPLTAGTYTVRVRSTGYKTQDVEIEVPTEGGVTVHMADAEIFTYNLLVRYPGSGSHANHPVVGAHVHITGPFVDVVEITGTDGRISLDLEKLDDEDYTVSISSHNGMNTFTVVDKLDDLPNTVTLSSSGMWYFRAIDLAGKGDRQFQIDYRYAGDDDFTIQASSIDANGNFVLPVRSGQDVRLRTRCPQWSGWTSWSNVVGSWVDASDGNWTTRDAGGLGAC